MGVITRLKKSGNSQAFHVPKAFAAAHNLDISARFSMEYKAGKIIIEALPEVVDDAHNESAMVEMMLADFTPENANKDLLKGPARGKELV
jgi:antitoxin component of MazEF toxin-antitoxin module